MIPSYEMYRVGKSIEIENKWVETRDCERVIGQFIIGYEVLSGAIKYSGTRQWVWLHNFVNKVYVHFKNGGYTVRIIIF